MQRIAVEDRRTALFGAAVTVIARHGISSTTVRAIAAEAGMPVASFHYVFVSREAMLAELVPHLLTEQFTAVRAAVAGAASPREFVERALLDWFAGLRADPEVEQALLELVGWSRTVFNLEDVPANVYLEYQTTAEAILALVEQTFRIRWRPSRADAARLVVVLTDGVSARWLVDRDDAAGERMLQLATDAIVSLIDRSEP